MPQWLPLSFINCRLLPVKCHYYLFFGASAGVLPFLIKYFMQMGMSEAGIGVLYSVLPFVVLITKPAIGAVADKFQQQKAIFLGCITLMISSFFAILFIPELTPPEVATTNLRCHGSGMEISLCSDAPLNGSAGHSLPVSCDFSCFTFANNSLLQSLCNASDTKRCKAEELVNTTSFNFSAALLREMPSSVAACDHYRLQLLQIFKQPVAPLVCSEAVEIPCTLDCSSSVHQFNDSQVKSDTQNVIFTSSMVWLITCMVLGWIGLGAATSMGDAIVLDVLGDQKNMFGRQRLWGAVGWGSWSIFTGLLIDWVSGGRQKSVFDPGFVVVLVLGVLDILISTRIQVIKTRKPKHIARDISKLFCKPEIFLFASAVFMIGILTGVLWTFLIVFMNNMGASQLQIGVMLGVQCFIGELPFFFISDWFLKKIGHIHSMTLVLAIFGARFIAYSFISDPWTVLPIELTQGITYGVFFTAVATYTSTTAPPGTSSTMQGILQGIFEGFGVGIGNLLGGVFYHMLGGRLMFLIFGLTSCISCVLYSTLQWGLKRISSNEPPSRDLKGEGVELTVILDRCNSDTMKTNGDLDASSQPLTSFRKLSVEK